MSNDPVDVLREDMDSKFGALDPKFGGLGSKLDATHLDVQLILERIKPVEDLKDRVRVLELAQARIYGFAIALGGIAGGAGSMVAQAIKG